MSVAAGTLVLLYKAKSSQCELGKEGKRGRDAPRLSRQQAHEESHEAARQTPWDRYETVRDTVQAGKPC